MALNIFPRRETRRETTEESAPESLPEPAKPAASSTATGDEAAPKPRRTRSRRTTARTADAAEQPAEEKEAAVASAKADAPPAEGDAEEEKPRRTRRSRSRSTAAKDETAAEVATPEPAEAEEKPKPARRTRSTARKDDASDDKLDPAALLKAIEMQAKQIEALTKKLDDVVIRLDRPATATQLPRVGVFVDVANVELGADRARLRLDWGKVLKLLGKDREVIAAIAYSPVHDDPQVSKETQRFVEPFLDKGYKIVTKPLKRFSDGTVKANVDIELALEVVSMLEKLDVVCLVSGDGDFEPLVRAAQKRGVRVEVIAMGNSCAQNLKAASDSFLDLNSRQNEVRA